MDPAGLTVDTSVVRGSHVRFAETVTLRKGGKMDKAVYEELKNRIDTAIKRSPFIHYILTNGVEIKSYPSSAEILKECRLIDASNQILSDIDRIVQSAKIGKGGVARIGNPLKEIASSPKKSPPHSKPFSPSPHLGSHPSGSMSARSYHSKQAGDSPSTVSKTARVAHRPQAIWIP